MDGTDCDRWNRLHREIEHKTPWIETCLAGTEGVYVAASDYVKALPESIGKWFPKAPVALGTDGFGRSESRAELRRFFEVDAAAIVIATLDALAREGKIERDVVHSAIADLEIDIDAPNPIDGLRREVMTTTITIPELGEGVDKVDVVAVLVKVGDTIEVDQPLIEVETDKAAVEIPATIAGTVTEIHVEAGATIGPDAPIVTVEADAPPRARSRDRPKTTESASPSPDATDHQEQKQQQGPRQKQGGSSGRIRARGSGRSSDRIRDRGSGRRAATAIRDSDRNRLTTAPANPSFRTGQLIPAAPTVRRFAREVGIDISTVTGSGPGGRISIDDVKAEANRRLSRGGGGGLDLPSADLPDFSRWGAIRREPMSKVRSLTSEAMTRAWLTAPQVTNHDLADITELEDLRQAYKRGSRQPAANSP